MRRAFRTPSSRASTYVYAIEAVDNAGNVSPNRSAASTKPRVQVRLAR